MMRPRRTRGKICSGSAWKKKLLLPTWAILLLLLVVVAASESRQSGDGTNVIGRHDLLTPDASNSEVLKELGVDMKGEVTTHKVTTVLGSSAELPCNLSSTIPGDSVKLVLWFKNNSALPIYTFDTRGQATDSPRHYSDDEVFGGRAYFRGDFDPGRLFIDNVNSKDEGLYQCRVDFMKAPTRIFKMYLNVIMPPQKPRIFNMDGTNREIRLKLGPYRVGETVSLKCEAIGGKPLPQVTWWRDHALMDDSYEVIEDYKVENELTIRELDRSDTHSILTCQAANNNISVPISTSVKLDMIFGPTQVRILNKDQPTSAGKYYELQCQALGARPPPTITWWLAGQMVTGNQKSLTSPDGNVTISTLSWTPSISDTGSRLLCRAGNVGLPESTLEDSWTLEVHYVPSSTLTLGSKLNASNIKEGDDVYFECAVVANPAPYKITWKHNGQELSHNVRKRVIISGQSLVLQKISRAESGVYTCTAHNSEGDGVSNSINLNIRYKPFCKPGQVKVYGVAKHEKIHVSCEVIANPKTNLKFEWIFNASSEKIDLPDNLVEVSGSRSLAEHVPKTEMDYGSLMCWATNNIGRQEEPCVYHLIPAGRPEPLANCSIQNKTYSTLHVSCKAGFDGGLPQSFSMHVIDSKTHIPVSNTTNTRQASFTATGLRPGTSYIVSVASSNSKGSSTPFRLTAFTNEMSDQLAESGESALTRVGEFTVTPILAILLAVAGAVVLVIILIFVYICFSRKPSSRNARKPSPTTTSPLGLHGSGGASNKGRALVPSELSKTHIPLQCDIDDCVDGSDASERNPDLIPLSKESRSTSEEDGGFGTFGGNTTYTTLQRLIGEKHHLPQNQHNQPQFLETTNVPKCYPPFSSHHTKPSREITYAQFTLPRSGGGYSQMRPAGEPAVIYSRMGHGDGRNGTLPLGASGCCNPTSCAANFSPLQVATGSSSKDPRYGAAATAAAVAGTSPNSLMNMSLDSCSSSSRCQNSGRGSATHHGYAPCPRAPSSTDEGFTSSSSPVNAPLITSPGSDMTSDTANLVKFPKHSASSTSGVSSDSASSTSSSTGDTTISYERTTPLTNPHQIPLLADSKESRV